MFDTICSALVGLLLWAQAFNFSVNGNMPMTFCYAGFGLGYFGLAMVFASGGAA